MSVLYDEIAEQPAAIRRALEANAGPVAELVAEIRRRSVRLVVLAARGTSDNAATYAKYLLQVVCGVPVAMAAPSVHTLYDADVRYGRDALMIGISQSGAGEDINEVMARGRAAGALTVAITNTDGSRLTEVAEHVLHCHAGTERAVAATKSYTTTLALMALLAAHWSESAELQLGLAGIEAAARRAMAPEVDARVRPLAMSLLHAERLLTVARGLHLATAVEAALKLAETTSSPTQAFSSADLLHGPIASVAVRTPCLLFAPSGRTVPHLVEVGERLRARGARVLWFAAESDAPFADVVPLADPGTELLAPLVDIIPAQLLAYHLTSARGLDPDNPQGLTKVTITR
jgi:glucosamine--fructose-6-phosphate aminotransferase (isomerizing)